MKIDLSIINKEISNLKKIEEMYFNLYKNYYNKISEIDKQWNNKYEKMLMQNIESEKASMNLVYNDLTLINSIYEKMYKGYSELGNKIYINVNKEEEIVNKMNGCINHLNRIIKMLDYVSVDSNQIYLLNNTKQMLFRELDVFRALCNNVVNAFIKVKKIENQIHDMLLKINIETVKVSDITNYVEP